MKIKAPQEIKTEADVLKYCKVRLKESGWYVIRIQQGIGCHPGVSDLIAVKAGIVVFVEVKSPKWKPRSENSASKTQRDQEAFEDAILRHGVTYCRVKSGDDVDELTRMA